MATTIQEDTFQATKQKVVERKLPVRICWEFRDADQWTIEFEEKSSACRFRVSGDATSNVAEMVKQIEAHAFSYRRRAKG